MADRYPGERRRGRRMRPTSTSQPKKSGADAGPPATPQPDGATGDRARARGSPGRGPASGAGSGSSSGSGSGSGSAGGSTGALSVAVAPSRTSTVQIQM